MPCWEEANPFLNIRIKNKGGIGRAKKLTLHSELEHIPYPQPGLEALSDVERRSGMAVLPRTLIMAPTDAGPVAKKGNMVLTIRSR